MLEKRKCFVIMGFGKKTDFATQRTLDLDKTYKIIQRAVEAEDLECIRADTILHSGVIDKPMYELLFEADLVIADLSTSNPNALYELGVRHALRPHSTIIIAEDKFKFPFDLSHVVINTYKHLATGIDFEEAERLIARLRELIRATVLSGAPKTDSPVFEFLKLKRPLTTIDTAVPQRPEGDKNFSELNERFREARADERWTDALDLMVKLRALKEDDPYLIQQHALATYKSKTPNPLQSLRNAKSILEALDPDRCTDAETLGLWGAIHKRILSLDPEDSVALNAAINAYESGFYLRRDHYNGINYAYMLNVRAARPDTKDHDRLTDKVIAYRMREEILRIVREALKRAPRASPAQRYEDAAEAYWILATRAEAELGLGRVVAVVATIEALKAQASEGWMWESTRGQLRSLIALEPWPEHLERPSLEPVEALLA